MSKGAAQDSLLGIPTVPFKRDGCKTFDLSKIHSIIVDAKYSQSRDQDGQTLIPPTLHEFATTFAEDLNSTLGIRAGVKTGNPVNGNVYITLGKKADYKDAAGRPTSEGYTLTTNSSGVYITGASPLGAWWATRTVLQQAALRKENGVPYGSGSDAPGWGTRGMMLDAGRHWYPKEFIVELCSYVSFFKQNVFHFHVSDNLYNNQKNSLEQSMSVPAWFRLWSDNPEFKGLSRLRNESYSRADFEEIEQSCAARGVTVLPEIEAPGHALPIVQWKPELGLTTDRSLLNISHPETIPTMKAIWKEFLPWFHTKVVSIGADEYTGPANDYNKFVNELDTFVKAEANKSIRIWGTFPPKFTPGYNNIHKDVSVQHWEYFEDNPLSDYIANGYQVVNSNDDFYIVNKWGPSYGNYIKVEKTFHGDPSVNGGGRWNPTIFNQKNVSDNPKRSEPLVLGAITPLWNDYGQNATVASEAYYAWRDGIPALSDKFWGGKMNESDYQKLWPRLHQYIPGQNLDRAIPSKGDTIFQYKFNGEGKVSSVKDLSQNKYNAHTTCETKGGALQVNPQCSLTTPWSSKGREYTLSLSLKVDKVTDKTNTTLISGSDSALMLTPNITLFASGSYYRLNTTLPMGSWVDLEIRGRGNSTFASVTPQGKDTRREQFQTKMGINGERFHWDVIAVEAPIKEVTGWTGELKELTLTNKA